MIVIGIDPGITGALAVVEDGKRLLRLEDLPTAGNGGGKVKNSLDAAALTRITTDIKRLAGSEYLVAVLEKVAAMPGQGVSSMFSLGDTFGVIRGVLAAKAIPVHLASPTIWKKAMQLTSNKDDSRAWASRRFPEASVGRKKDHNRAEAIALACWGWKELA